MPRPPSHRAKAMAEFRYLAIDEGGRERRGQIKADDKRAAEAALARRNFHVIECAPGVAESGKAPLLSLTRNNSNTDLNDYHRETVSVTARYDF